MNEWGIYTCDEIKKTLETITKIDHTSEIYVRTKEALFIHDIICLFKAIDEEEIRGYLKLVSHEVGIKQIQRSIFCLVKLGLINPVGRGNKTYYVPSSLSANRFLSLPKALDSARLAMQLDKYYKHPAQLARRKVIQDANRGMR